MDDGGGGAGAGKLPKVGKEKGSVISFPWGKKNMGQTINKASFPNQQLLPLICFVRQVFSTDENLDLKLSWIYLNEDPSLWGSGN